MRTVSVLVAMATIVSTTTAFLAPSTGLRPTLSRSSSSAARTARMTPMMARRSFIAGNWKENPATVDEAVALAKAVSAIKPAADVDVAVIAPFPFLVPVQQAIKGSKVWLGAQDFYTEDKGAFTGAVGTTMIKSVGAEWVLCGHSERRAVFGDSDAIVNVKVHHALERGFKVILCIGETKDEYELGINKLVCGLQLAKGLKGITKEQMKDIVIAYEPVWAIGTGLTATPEIAQDVHANIREIIKGSYGADVAANVVIQYGGSVTPETVDELMAMPDIDGALVGGASLVADKFGRIVQFQK